VWRKPWSRHGWGRLESSLVSMKLQKRFSASSSVCYAWERKSIIFWWWQLSCFSQKQHLLGSSCAHECLLNGFCSLIKEYRYTSWVSYMRMTMNSYDLRWCCTCSAVLMSARLLIVFSLFSFFFALGMIYWRMLLF